MAVQYAGFDEGIKAIVFQGFAGNMGVKNSIFGVKENQPHYCHILPYFDSVIKQEAYIGLLSPRPTPGLRGSKENPVRRQVITEYAKGWESEGKLSNFQFSVFEGGHEYSVSDAILYFDGHL